MLAKSDASIIVRRLMGFRRIAPLALLAPLVGPGIARAAGETGGTGEVKVHEFDATGTVTAATESPPTYVTYFSPGPMISFVEGDGKALGLGVEASIMDHRRLEILSPAFGGFVQAQLYDGTHPRVGFGGQASLGPIGVELGLAFRGADAQRATTLAAHAALFASFGYLVFAVRESPPIIGFGGGAFGNETAIVLSLKIPIVIGGVDPSGLAVGRHL
jgi:hypothetical protein